MSTPATPFDDVFLFNSGNRAYVRGETSKIASSVGAKHVTSFLLYLLTMALPIGFIGGIVVALLAPIHPFDAIVYMTAFMLFFSAIISLSGYVNARRAEKFGQLFRGEIIKYDSRQSFGGQGIKPGVRVYYNVTLPDGTTVTLNKLISQSLTHLPDGRPLPPPGTAIAVLYLDKIWHMPL
jgi:hypothetical protein